jgi:hypothetical protein
MPLTSKSQTVAVRRENDSWANAGINWTTIRFGRFKDAGMSPPQVLLSDPDYFYWALRGGAFKGRQAYQAAFLSIRASQIRPPRPNSSEFQFAILLDESCSLSEIRLVRKSEPISTSLIVLRRSALLDLSIVKLFPSAQKVSGEKIVAFLKKEFFADSFGELDRRSCEAFFEDDSHFWIGSTVSTKRK